MKAIYVVKHGKAEDAFELRDTEKPTPKPGEVLIKVEGFGLNFADVIARRGLYQDAPPLPSVLGYDICGIVERKGSNVDWVETGDRVTALTRFGGYAEYAVTDARAIARIPLTMDIAEATALTTQYCTAYYCCAEMVNLYPGDKVVIHSAAGGVGTALMQYCVNKGCEIFATTGSASKVEMLKKMGAAHVIDTSATEFDDYIDEVTKGDGVDVIFDAIGAGYIRRGIKVLANGGRIVCYGVSAMSDSTNIFSKLGKAIEFGIYHPGEFMMHSKSLIGVNMLRIADAKPNTLKRVLENVVRLYEEGIFKPQSGKIFKAADISEAHKYMESRKSIGKLACTWD